MQRCFKTGVAACVILVVVVIGTGRVLAQNEDTQTSMRSIFAALTTAYMYSMDPDAFTAPENREQVAAALELLANTSQYLEKHAGELDPSFDYMRRSLANDGREAARRYQTGQYAGSHFVLTAMTENCMNCHARVENAEPFDLGDRFLKQFNIKELDARDRVSIEVAVRQFDDAMDTYEEIFADRELTPRLILLMSAPEGYLRLALGVFSDTNRPMKTFEKFMERADMSDNVRDIVMGWNKSLSDLDLAVARGHEVVVARQLIGDTSLARRFTSDRNGLVDCVEAEVLLRRYLMSNPDDTLDIAEAYYLLAVAESLASHSYWVSETPFLLEQAIRYSPHTPLASIAFAFLEDYTLAAYAGSYLPTTVEATLDELDQLSR